MKKRSFQRLAAAIALGLACSSLTAQAPLLSFPTAEGFGKYAKGGRGGKVVEVTNLLDYDTNAGETEIEGSFRWALKQFPGEPLTIVFRVSGVVQLKPGTVNYASNPKNQNDIRAQRDGLTIAGQTAPGEGITFTGAKLNFGGCKNLVIRNIRGRIGMTSDKLLIPGGSLGIENAQDWIVDHCSFGWSSEENMTIYDNIRTTVQWTIVHEGLYDGGHGKGVRGYGCQWGGRGATYHHNLLIHNKTRSPRFNGARGDNDLRPLIDYINNVNYNWGDQGACYGSDIAAGTTRENYTNFIGNYYKPGPSTTSKHCFTRISNGGNKTIPSKFFFQNNIIEGNAEIIADNWKGVYWDFNFAEDRTLTFTSDDLKADEQLGYPRPTMAPYSTMTAYDNYKLTPESPEDALQSVIKRCGPIVRDSVDRRLIRETRDNTTTFKGKWGNGGVVDDQHEIDYNIAYPEVKAPDDTDHDGMPDAWEVNKGLNPSDPEDRNIVTQSGYTALEVYLCELMGETIPWELPNSIVENNLKSVKIYPTVVQERIFIETESTIIGFSLTSIDGRIVAQNAFSPALFNFSGITPGQYLLQLHFADGQKQATTIVKQ